MIRYLTNQSIRYTLFACTLFITACATSPFDSELPIALHLTQDIAQRLSKQNNEVHIPNISYVTQEKMWIESREYSLLSFHTTDGHIYRTRVETSKLNHATLERLKALKSATFIGVLPIEGYNKQYFFRNYKNLAF